VQGGFNQKPFRIGIWGMKGKTLNGAALFWGLPAKIILNERPEKNAGKSAGLPQFPLDLGKTPCFLQKYTKKLLLSLCYLNYSPYLCTPN